MRLLDRLVMLVVVVILLDLNNSPKRSTAIPMVTSTQPNRHKYAHNGRQQQ